MTANKMIPLNDREPGEIAQVAIDQLKPYQVAAKTWGVYPDDRATRCKRCDQCIWFTFDPHGEIYHYDDEEIQSLIVAHIRQVHPNEV